MAHRDFRDPVVHLDAWHRKTGKPVLLADAAGLRNPAPPGGFVPNDGEWYAEGLIYLCTRLRYNDGSRECKEHCTAS